MMFLIPSEPLRKMRKKFAPGAERKKRVVPVCKDNIITSQAAYEYGTRRHKVWLKGAASLVVH